MPPNVIRAVVKTNINELLLKNEPDNKQNFVMWTTQNVAHFGMLSHTKTTSDQTKCVKLHKCYVFKALDSFSRPQIVLFPAWALLLISVHD